jgi:hypothetical protein
MLARKAPGLGETGGQDKKLHLANPLYRAGLPEVKEICPFLRGNCRAGEPIFVCALRFRLVRAPHNCALWGES